MSFASVALLALASPVGLAHETPREDHVEASYDALAAGDNQQAIKAIDLADALAKDDPARLINLGIAYAREGRFAQARTMFEAAERSDMRYRLELADGNWIDSRRLAQRALVMLDGGAFASNSRMAQR